MRISYNISGLCSTRSHGFCLIEVVTTVVILAIMCSTVMVVMGRNMDAAFDMRMKVNATQIVRENLERLLIAHSVNEQTDYGTSERFPGIRWETTVESFAPPLGESDWVRAVCKAEYEDANGQTRTVELVHWLTPLTDAQASALDEMNQADAYLLSSLDEAADYAGVDREMIEMWIDGGLKQTDTGEFISSNLDLFIRTGGMPSEQELQDQLLTLPEPGDIGDGADEGEAMEAAPVDLPEPPEAAPATRRRR